MVCLRICRPPVQKGSQTQAVAAHMLPARARALRLPEPVLCCGWCSSNTPRGVRQWISRHSALPVDITAELQICWHVLQVTLNTTLRDEIASGYVVYEYITYPLECEPRYSFPTWWSLPVRRRPYSLAQH